MKIAIIGSGYWGPKLVKNFYAIPEIVLVFLDRTDNYFLAYQ